MRLIKYAALGLLSFSCIAFSGGKETDKHPSPKQKNSLKRIVIDAGHGGSDIGARGAYSTEKEVSLKIALRLQQELNAEMPDIDVVMTRTTDVFDRPTVKANKANDARGDLFISIHCNWAPGKRHSEWTGEYRTETYYKGKGKKRKKYTRKEKVYRHWTESSDVRGTETFIWNINKNDDKEKALADHEEMFMDPATAEELKNFNPNDPEKVLMYSLTMRKYFDRSARLAYTIEEEFKKTGRPSRMAQQRKKGIWVLQAVAMPAILIETGFISNTEEENYLNSAEGQKEIAEVVVKSIKRYKALLENPASGNTNSNKK